MDQRHRVWQLAERLNESSSRFNSAVNSWSRQRHTQERRGLNTHALSVLNSLRDSHRSLQRQVHYYSQSYFTLAVAGHSGYKCRVGTRTAMAFACIYSHSWQILNSPIPPSAASRHSLADHSITVHIGVSDLTIPYPTGPPINSGPRSRVAKWVALAFRTIL